MRIRNMVTQDVDFVFELAAEEQWGYTKPEFERMLELAPDGSFIAEEGGVRQGFVTTSSYGRTGSIGHLVVAKERRGKAIGRGLMRRAIEHLDSIGAESILLNAVVDATPFYERFGFRTLRAMQIYKMSFEQQVKDGLRSRCPPMEPSDLPQVRALDSTLFGDDRTKVVSRLHSEFPGHAFKVEREGRLRGFALGRTTPAGSDVGPWICHPCDRALAEDLLFSLLSTLPSGTVHFAVFSDNKLALDIIHGIGPGVPIDTRMMVRGQKRYVGPPYSILGIAATEYG
jgi:GNAT superfamily N-acetyltransferase